MAVKRQRQFLGNDYGAPIGCFLLNASPFGLHRVIRLRPRDPAFSHYCRRARRGPLDTITPRSGRACAEVTERPPARTGSRSSPSLAERWTMNVRRRRTDDNEAPPGWPWWLMLVAILSVAALSVITVVVTGRPEAVTVVVAPLMLLLPQQR